MAPRFGGIRRGRIGRSTIVAQLRPVEQPRGIIQTGNLAQKLISAFGIKGKVVAPSLGETVHPTVIVEDLTRASWYNQEVERPAAGGNFLTPTVAQFQSFQLFNPATSGVVVILDEVTAYIPSTAGQIFFGIGQTQLAVASTTTSFRDTVQLASQTPACLMRSESLVAAGFGTTHTIASASSTNIPLKLNPGVILAPGWGYRVDSQLATVALAVSFSWRERYIAT